MIYLVDEPYDEVNKKIDYMMGHENGIREIFYYKRDRLICSALACLIKDSRSDIGFLNLVNENIENILFVDQGILEKYRGQGYGKKAIEILISTNNFNEYLIGETKKDNLLANRSASNIGKLIYMHDSLNYYLFQKERTNEFLDSKEFYNIKQKVLKR